MIDEARVGGVTGVAVKRKTEAMRSTENDFNNEQLETLIPRLLNENGGRVGKVAALIGISRHSLYVWCLRLDIPVGKPRGAHK